MSTQRRSAPVQGKPVRHITDFFKPFTVPKSRVPVNDIVEDEIIVASPQRSPTRRSAGSQKSVSPVKRRSPEKVAKLSRNSSISSTPSRKTPRRSALKRSLTSLDDLTDDEPLIYTGPASSQQRIMTAVSIPSPKPQSSATPSPVKQEPPKATMTSFSSISTLSSVPLSSQSTSRRIMKGGLQAVTNSDSGSMDDSSDELADIDALIPRKKMRMTPPIRPKESVEDAPSTVKPQRQSTRLSDKSNRNDGGRQRHAPSPPRVVYKHSLLKMARETEKKARQDAKIAEVQAEMDEAERRRQAQEAAARMITGTAVMAAVAADDSDEGERMKMAMERTEALVEEQTFSLFLNGKICVEDFDFPVGDLPDERWAMILKNERARTQACLTGFVAELARMGRLTRNITRWFAEQVVRETQEDICEAYVEIIRACAAHSPDNVDKGIWLLSAFYDIRTKYSGRKVQEEPGEIPISDVESRTHMLHNISECTGSRSPGLRHVANIVHYCAPLIGTVAVSAAFVELALANLDEQIQRDTALRMHIQNAMEGLAQSVLRKDQIKMQRQLVNEIVQERSLSRLLKAQLIAALPASSPATHEVRRLLALHYITGGEFEDQYTYEYTPPTPDEWAKRLLHCLKSNAEFAILDVTDYTLLSVLAVVLDIAIDAGFEADFAFLQEAAEQPTGPFGKPLAPSKAEQAFNANVDAFADQLRLTASRIKDAGATHLRRTEAKSALERVIVRLEHTVRTRPKPRKGVFGSGLAGSEQRAFLESFVKKADLIDERDRPSSNMLDVPELEARTDALLAAQESLPEQPQACVVA